MIDPISSNCGLGLDADQDRRPDRGSRAARVTPSAARTPSVCPSWAEPPKYILILQKRSHRILLFFRDSGAQLPTATTINIPQIVALCGVFPWDVSEYLLGVEATTLRCLKADVHRDVARIQTTAHQCAEGTTI